ncbi:hypothetical protein CMI47_21225 [Candidatus Pacearchaeota archaeon]|jgi:hypothetical protein|nr:hypothetical protein [Candidatus Pacearchaeota archaeon]|tara:strand:- start:4943 stop:7108 length:2166 start_codon:yes stop_codon:yes gene_type:complete
MEKDTLEELNQSFSSLKSSFSKRVRNEISWNGADPKELAYKVHKRTGISESTIYEKIDNTRYRDPEGLFPWQYKFRDNEKTLVLPRKNKRVTGQVGAILHELGVPEEDPLIQQMRDHYGNFEYPPRIPSNRSLGDKSRIENDIDLTDPKYLDDYLLFIRDLNSSQGFGLEFQYESDPDEYNQYFRTAIAKKIKDNESLSLFVNIEYDGWKDVPGTQNTVINRYPKGFADFVERRGSIGSMSLNDVTFESTSISDFKRYRKKIRSLVDICRHSDCSKEEYGGQESIAAISIERDKDGKYKIDNVTFSELKIENGVVPFEDDFKDIAKFYTEGEREDFRPHLHRMFEIFSRMPKMKWHDPGIYYRPRIPAQAKDTDVSSQKGFLAIDPMEFTREKAKELGINLTWKNPGRHSPSELLKGWGWIYEAFVESGGRLLSFYLHGNRNNEKFVDFVKKVRRKGKAIGKFNLDRGKMEDFGEHLEDIVFDLEFDGDSECLSRRGPEEHYNDPTMAVYVKKNSEGFCLDRLKLTTAYHDDQSLEELDWNKKQFDIEGIGSIVNSGDFRPFLHRALEAYAEIPRNEWHNPLIYSESFDIQALDSVVNQTVETLFTGEERIALENKLETARLRMRKGWASIPKLSIGAVKLPTPGQKNVRDDSFVTEAAPFFIEYMSALGIMDEAEAEEVMARKLTNYFVHHGGFQLNQDRARQIVGQLREKDKQVLEGVA